MAGHVRGQHAVAMMRKPAAMQGPSGLIEAGAVQKHNGRLRAIEFPAAGGGECLIAVHGNIHGSSFLRNTERLAQVVDDIGGGFDTNRQPHKFLTDAGCLELIGIHLLMSGAAGMND